MKILVTGATGLVGGELIRQAVLDNTIEEITAITRSPLEIHDPKIKTVIHQDFLDYSDLTQVFKNNNSIVWCLGISQSQVSEEAYKIITYKYTIAAAKAAIIANPDIILVFLSGQGANQEGRAKTLFGQIKGKTEKDLLALGFKNLYFIRPAGIQPIHKNNKTALLNKLVIPFYPLIKLIVPSLVITSVELARSILNILKNGHAEKIIENKELKNLANN